MKVVTILIAYHLSLTTSLAQTFTDRLQKSGKGEGKVTIHQSQAIEDLVNGPKSAPPAGEAGGGSKKTTTAAAAADPTAKSSADAGTKEPTVKQGKDTANDTVSVVNFGRPHKIIGYRVQAYAGGSSRHDRQKAEQTATTIKQLFPTVAVYPQYDNPRWTCRVGNFRTREEAKEMLAEIRKLGFTSANIIKTKVIVYD